VMHRVKCNQNKMTMPEQYLHSLSAAAGPIDR